MNAQQKTAAIKKYSGIKKQGTTKAEMADLLKNDENKYSAADQKIILDEVFKEDPGTTNTPPPVTPPAPMKTKASKKAESPNDDLDLKGFDYSNLVGKKFKEYVELVGDRCFVSFDPETGKVEPVNGQLQTNKSFDFECYKAAPVMKERFPGMKDTPVDFIGITLKNTTPEFTTRMSVANAIELNGQILNPHSRAGFGKYYLLKK